MKPFKHTNAKSMTEVQTALAGGKTTLIAGGTDLIGTLKDNILPTYPPHSPGFLKFSFWWRLRSAVKLADGF